MDKSTALNTWTREYKIHCDLVGAYGILKAQYTQQKDCYMHTDVDITDSTGKSIYNFSYNSGWDYYDAIVYWLYVMDETSSITSGNFVSNINIKSPIPNYIEDD